MRNQLPESSAPPAVMPPAPQLALEAYWLMMRHAGIYAGQVLALAAVCTFRLLVALNPDISLTRDWATQVEPYLFVASRYPQVQMLVYGFGLMPFAILAAIALWRRPSRGLAIWAWFFAGVVVQGQFGHIVATQHAAAIDARYAPGDGFAFWVVNLAVALIPLWFALRYERKLRGAQG